MHTRLSTMTKKSMIAAVVSLAMAGTAAAALGSPGPADESVPPQVVESTTTASTDDVSDEESVPESAPESSAPVGPDVTGPAATGLCRAWTASNGHPRLDNPAWSNLQAAAGAMSTDEYCDGVLAAAARDDADDADDADEADEADDADDGAGASRASAASGHRAKGARHRPFGG